MNATRSNYSARSFSIADVAVNGSVGPAGLCLFAIVFFWQPPHVWAIALYRKEAGRPDVEPAVKVYCLLEAGKSASRAKDLVAARAAGEDAPIHYEIDLLRVLPLGALPPVCGNGSVEEGERLLQPLKELAKPILDLSGRVP